MLAGMIFAIPNVIATVTTPSAALAKGSVITSIWSDAEILGKY